MHRRGVGAGAIARRKLTEVGTGNGHRGTPGTTLFLPAWYITPAHPQV
uniref:Uncharacterized protein n=1 Tax=Malurus cyaneus samueli TaxID=2593467 RepID=A0A8C5TQK3_9PASS